MTAIRAVLLGAVVFVVAGIVNHGSNNWLLASAVVGVSAALVTWLISFALARRRAGDR